VVVVVRPEAGVVVELGDVVDLVFGFDVAMLRGADINTDSAFIKCLEVYAATLDCFAGAVDCNTAGACADTQFLTGLVFLGVEVAYASGNLAHVAHVDHLYTSDPIEEILAVFFECVAVGRRQAEACYNYARLMHE
jgi:hypothetical protein